MRFDIVVVVLMFVAILLVWILFSPLKLNIKIGANMHKQQATIKVRFFVFTVFKAVLMFDGDELVLLTKKKRKEVFLWGKVNITFNHRIVLKLIESKQLELFFVGGIAGNEYAASMICGTVNAAFCVLTNAIGDDKNINLKTKVKMTREDVLTFDAKFVGFISIAKIILVIILIIANTIFEAAKRRIRNAR